MDTKEYISSGILELYAAGLLSESESNEAENVIRNNPEVRDELNKIYLTLQLSISPNLKTPPAKIKASILDKIKKPESGVQIEKSGNTYKYLMAASIAFLTLSLGANFFLWDKLKDAQKEISVLSEQKRIITQEYETVNRKLNKASEDMNIMKDRTYMMADLKGLEKSPNSNVITFWNPETKKVFVEVISLPVPPSNKQYQLWALSNGKPVDAGVMDIDPSDKSLHEMKNIEDAQAFAITLEPKGGSVNPTLTEMYVMGKL